jgi:hypothetical protein
MKPLRAAVPLGLALALAVGLTACGGSASEANPTDTITTGAYQPVAPPTLRRSGPVHDGAVETSGTKKLEVVTEPYSLSKTDVSVSIQSLGHSRYSFVVTNTSPYAYLDSFTWQPAQRWTVTAVKAGGAGTCSLVPGALSKQLAIGCDSLDLRPPSCTCLKNGTIATLSGNGGSATIVVTMHEMRASKYIDVGTPYERLRGAGSFGTLNITGQTLVLHTRSSSSGTKPTTILNLTSH